MVDQYDGRRPAALDLFLDILGIDEVKFMELVAPHVVAPHELPTLEEIKGRSTNEAPADFSKWPRITGDARQDLSRK